MTAMRSRKPGAALVQACCGNDPASHVGAAFGRGSSISHRTFANNRRGFAISASWNVTCRPNSTGSSLSLVPAAEAVSGFSVSMRRPLVFGERRGGDNESER